MDTKVCTKCGIEKPVSEFYVHIRNSSGYSPRCKECAREDMRLYHQSPKGKEASHVYYLSNPHKWNINRLPYSEWSEERKAKTIKRDKVYKQSEEYKEYMRKYQREYRKTPEGKAEKARSRHKRRSTMKDAVNDLTATEWEEIKEAQDYRCALCGEVRPLQRDHIIPVTKGGGLTKSNVQGLCCHCNPHKRDKLMEEILILDRIPP